MQLDSHTVHLITLSLKLRKLNKKEYSQCIVIVGDGDGW